MLSPARPRLTIICNCCLPPTFPLTCLILHVQIEAQELHAQMRRANEERAGLQQRLSELMEKITVLPGFYQQRIFLGDAAPDLFEALTQDADGASSSGFW